jgi:hypothetical protein
VLSTSRTPEVDAILRGIAQHQDLDEINRIAVEQASGFSWESPKSTCEDQLLRELGPLTHDAEEALEDMWQMHAYFGDDGLVVSDEFALDTAPCTICLDADPHCPMCHKLHKEETFFGTEFGSLTVWKPSWHRA